MAQRIALLSVIKRGLIPLIFTSTQSRADPTRQSREAVVNFLFLGALTLAFGAFVAVIVNHFFFQVPHLMPRIITVGLVFAVMLSFFQLSRRGRYLPAAFGLLAIYFCSAFGVLLAWGLNTPIGMLMFALFIIFTGASLGARYSLYAFLLVITAVILLATLAAADVVRPDLSWMQSPVDFTDITVFVIVFGNLTLVSWLFNRSMEQSLERAQRSEKALRRQKELLEVKVEERTRQAQAAQLERVQDLYRFAELGHMSVALLHDLANYLTVLSLDIEDLKQARQNRSAVIRRVQESIEHLNSLTGQVRHQIKGESTIARFNLADEIDQVIKLLQYKARAQQVSVAWQHPPQRKKLFYTGSINHFWQIMTNVISNAIDAYDGQPTAEQPRVLITAERADKDLTIKVVDFGRGISANKLEKIFEPFYSTKKKGTGIGLAIARRMIEKDFGGTIQVRSQSRRGTTFIISFPQHE